MVYLFLNFVLYNIFAFVAGMVEAYGDTDSLNPFITEFGLKIEKHKVYTFQRILVFIMMVNSLVFYKCWLHTEVYDIIILFITCVLSFSFIHDGAYFITKHNIDNSDVSWDSYSKTTTAKYEINFKTRLISFILSLVILISYVIIKVLYLS